MNHPAQIVIVGGGPSGLAAAIALRQHGYRVIVVDCAVPPIDKPCGEGLLPDSLMALNELGIAVPPEIGFHFQGIQFHSGAVSVAAGFPNGTGISVRRTMLHSLLLRRAADLDVSFIWNAKRVSLAPGGVSVNNRIVEANFVIGADGHNSQIRRQSGLTRTRRERRRYAFRRHYRLAPWSNYVELHWGPRCQIYITPLANHEICVALISRNPKLRIDDALTDFPLLRRSLREALHTSSEMGTLSVSRTLRRVCREDLALVGDASGSVDATTGEGLCMSFRQALALADAVKSGDLNSYQKQHEAISRRPHQMASLMLTLDTHQRLQRRFLAALAQRPNVFASLLSIHVGQSSFLDLCSWRLFDFGLKFLFS